MADDAKDLAEFKAFYETYEKACLERNADFLRSILPEGVPDDEFAFVLDISEHSARAVKDSGITPRIELDGDTCNVIYEGDLGDDMTELVLDFYCGKDGRWLKYNPEE